MNCLPAAGRKEGRKEGAARPIAQIMHGSFIPLPLPALLPLGPHSLSLRLLLFLPAPPIGGAAVKTVDVPHLPHSNFATLRVECTRSPPPPPCVFDCPFVLA